MYGAGSLVIFRRYLPGGPMNHTLDKASLLGPVDHEVELLLARRANGRPTAVLFGYACHATVLGEQSLHGDWCAPPALAPLPLIFSYKPEKSLCGTGAGRRLTCSPSFQPSR